MSRNSVLELRLALPPDDEGLRRLLRDNPMAGELGLALHREPDFFLGASIEGDLSHTLVARDPESGRLVGMGTRSEREAWINGSPSRLGYLSQLRVDREARDGRALAGILDALSRVTDPPLHVTVIHADNKVARRGMERDWPGKPIFHRFGELVSCIIPLLGRRSWPGGRVEIARGNASALPGIADCLQRNYRSFQLAPCWTAETLADPARVRGLRPEDFVVALQGGRVVGCLATWDQRAFKQTVIQRYPSLLERLRHLANLGSRVVGGPSLPAPGHAVAHVFLSHLAVDGQDPEIFLALLNAAWNRCVDEECGFLSLGLAADHPLLEVLRRSCWCIEHRMLVYIVFLEEHRAAAELLDRRPLHLELAVL